MPLLTPRTPEELCASLRDVASGGQTIDVRGRNTKQRYAGPQASTQVTISTLALNRILRYEPNDLTVSVEAGVLWSDLAAKLAAQRQMVALDAPFFSKATVGGVIATNGSGSWRQRYGTARDLVIGMQFATLDGKLIQAGGMVVKNVAGLDMGKLLIGSFGTLAVITSVNFRLHPLPEQTRTFLRSFPDGESAAEQSRAIRRSFLRPLALDLLAPPAAIRLGLRNYVVAVRAGGDERVLQRFSTELSSWETLSGEAEERFWADVREFPADFLSRLPSGIILRISAPLNDLAGVLRLSSSPLLARAGCGVAYLFLSSWASVTAIWDTLLQRGWTATIEAGPDELRAKTNLWLSPKWQIGESLALMRRVKHMFDANNLLNPGRLYNVI